MSRESNSLSEKLPFDPKNELFSASIMEKAVSQLLEQTSEKLVKDLQL